jgi:hypothetical protein
VSDLDPTRIAMVVASSSSGSRNAGESTEEVGTGYFLTGNLVLTARHVVEMPRRELHVRTEVGGSEEDRWQRATLAWAGTGDVDAALLRIDDDVADWELPDFVTTRTSGSWTSSGFGLGARDHDDRKTLPLNGTFNESRGQGPTELSLQTSDTKAPGWDDARAGMSGAPVFLEDPDAPGLLGLITDDVTASANRLIALPIARLLDDVQFRTTIYPSFLGALPSKPWCLILTAEGGGGELPGQVQDVLALDRHGDRLLEYTMGVAVHDTPIPLPVVEALGSVENWARTVDALARADFVVADVTGFQPAIMLLIGIRSVLRRGVTVSVTSTELARHATGLPFNVQETKVLSLTDESFQDQLYSSLVEGGNHLRNDPNYLDLPAFHAVRSPRPDDWLTEDGKSILVLCPFSRDYADVFAKPLRQILYSYSGMTPKRMLDIVSPRLVGQALYEQIRWATHCVVDWTEWRANVFFELGVRLACSPNDPLMILQKSSVEGRPETEPAHSTPLEQYQRLRQLFRPVEYDRNDPRPALAAPIELATGRARGELADPRIGTIPRGTTHHVAQASYVWSNDRSLSRPDHEQRIAAQGILGRDQVRNPERFVLFGDNSGFDTELRAAVREKWIAGWLYLRHLQSGPAGKDDGTVQAEMLDVGPLVVQALEGSTEARHVRLLREVKRLLESVETSNTDLNRVLACKAQAKTLRNEGDFAGATGSLSEAIQILQELGPTATSRFTQRLTAEFADCYGMIGGIERRWGLSLEPPNREERLRASLKAYHEGYRYEATLGDSVPNTYNRMNRLIARLLLEPQLLEDGSEASLDIATDLRELEAVLRRQVAGPRQRDPWGFADLGLVQLLRDAATSARFAFQELDHLRPPAFVYETTAATVGPLADVASQFRPELVRAVEVLQRSALTSTA